MNAYDPGMPRPVRWAASLTFLMAMYAGLCSIPMCLLGSFVGPHILIPGLIHAGLAFAFFFSWIGILNQMRWARWLMIALSTFVALAMPIELGLSLRTEPIHEGVIIYFLGISISFAMISWLLSTRAAKGWFLV